ncbi:MAG: hypothetical protein ACP5UA_05285 [Candidatus Hydrogenedens sp.]
MFCPFITSYLIPFLLLIYKQAITSICIEERSNEVERTSFIEYEVSHQKPTHRRCFLRQIQR